MSVRFWFCEDCDFGCESDEGYLADLHEERTGHFVASAL